MCCCRPCQSRDRRPGEKTAHHCSQWQSQRIASTIKAMAATLVTKRQQKNRKVVSGGQPRSGAAKRNGKRAKEPAARRIATEPTAGEIAEREAVAHALFNPRSARAARAAFMKRQAKT